MTTINVSSDQLPFVMRGLLKVIELTVTHEGYNVADDANDVQNVIHLLEQLLPKKDGASVGDDD